MIKTYKITCLLSFLVQMHWFLSWIFCFLQRQKKNFMHHRKMTVNINFVVLWQVFKWKLWPLIYFLPSKKSHHDCNKQEFRFMLKIRKQTIKRTFLCKPNNLITLSISWQYWNILIFKLYLRSHFRFPKPTSLISSMQIRWSKQQQRIKPALWPTNKQ